MLWLQAISEALQGLLKRKVHSLRTPSLISHRMNVTLPQTPDMYSVKVSSCCQGVQGYVILDKSGVPIKSSFEVRSPPARCPLSDSNDSSTHSASQCTTDHLTISAYALASPCRHDRHCCTVQPAAAQTYAGLVPPLVYLADDMVRDADPQVLCCPLRLNPAVSSPGWVEGGCAGVGMPTWQAAVSSFERLIMPLQDVLQFLRVRSAKQEIMVSARRFPTVFPDQLSSCREYAECKGPFRNDV